MAPIPPEKDRFHSNQICFYFNLGDVFPLPDFQAKLFLMRNWVGGFYRDSLLKLVLVHVLVLQSEGRYSSHYDWISQQKKSKAEVSSQRSFLYLLLIF